MRTPLPDFDQLELLTPIEPAVQTIAAWPQWRALACPSAASATLHLLLIAWWVGVTVHTLEPDAGIAPVIDTRAIPPRTPADSISVVGPPGAASRAAGMADSFTAWGVLVRPPMRCTLPTYLLSQHDRCGYLGHLPVTPAPGLDLEPYLNQPITLQICRGPSESPYVAVGVEQPYAAQGTPRRSVSRSAEGGLANPTRTTGLFYHVGRLVKHTTTIDNQPAYVFEAPAGNHTYVAVCYAVAGSRQWQLELESVAGQEVLAFGTSVYRPELEQNVVYLDVVTPLDKKAEAYLRPIPSADSWTVRGRLMPDPTAEHYFLLDSGPRQLTVMADRQVDLAPFVNQELLLTGRFGMIIGGGELGKIGTCKLIGLHLGVREVRSAPR